MSVRDVGASYTFICRHYFQNQSQLPVGLKLTSQKRVCESLHLANQETDRQPKEHRCKYLVMCILRLDTRRVGVVAGNLLTSQLRGKQGGQITFQSRHAEGVNIGIRYSCG